MLTPISTAEGNPNLREIKHVKWSYRAKSPRTLTPNLWYSTLPSSPQGRWSLCWQSFQFPGRRLALLWSAGVELRVENSLSLLSGASFLGPGDPEGKVSCLSLSRL